MILDTVGLPEGLLVSGEILGEVGAGDGCNVSKGLHLKKIAPSTYADFTKVIFDSS